MEYYDTEADVHHIYDFGIWKLCYHQPEHDDYSNCLYIQSGDLPAYMEHSFVSRLNVLQSVSCISVILSIIWLFVEEPCVKTSTRSYLRFFCNILALVSTTTCVLMFSQSVSPQLKSFNRSILDLKVSHFGICFYFSILPCFLHFICVFVEEPIRVEEGIDQPLLETA